MPRRALPLARSSPVPLPKTVGEGYLSASKPLRAFEFGVAVASRSQANRTYARLLTRPVPSPVVWERVDALRRPGEGPAEPAEAHRSLPRSPMTPLQFCSEPSSAKARPWVLT